MFNIAISLNVISLMGFITTFTVYKVILDSILDSGGLFSYSFITIISIMLAVISFYMLFLHLSLTSYKDLFLLKKWEQPEDIFQNILISSFLFLPCANILSAFIGYNNSGIHGLYQYLSFSYLILPALSLTAFVIIILLSNIKKQHNGN